MFVTWKGDHSPRHVHVFRDGRMVLKWDLEEERPMWGSAFRRLRRLLDELREEGLL